MTDRRINLPAARKHAEGARKRFTDYGRRIPVPVSVQRDIAWALEMIERMAKELEAGR